MRVIAVKKIEEAVSDLCVQANLVLRKDVLESLARAYQHEKNKKAKRALNAIIENAKIARAEKLAICQDTGMPCVFVEIGQDVKILGDFKGAIVKGVEAGYKKGYLRNSIVRDPLVRGKSGYAPPMIHFDIVKGDSLRLSVLPKGFGCENKTQLKMFRPTASLDSIKDFVVKTVREAGPDACPPYVIGVGIGGTADYASLLAKRALLRKVESRKSKVKSTGQKLKVQLMEKDLLKRINALNIGPMGLGGRTTALAVHIQTYPTHIAGLPVAVNISCHALRSATAVI